MIKKGVDITDGKQNKNEMAFNAYDLCFGCTTHTLPGQIPLELNIYDVNGKLINNLPYAEN